MVTVMFVLYISVTILYGKAFFSVPSEVLEGMLMLLASAFASNRAFIFNN